MGWITFTIVATVVLLAFAVVAARSAVVRRSDRLEAAFFRARGSRMISNGFIPGR